MTLVGKILTFLILIMSMVFMTFTMATYATHRNWRDMVQGANGKPGLKVQLDNAKQLLQESEAVQEAMRLQLERERASRREALAAKETRNTLMAGQLTELNQKHNAMQTEHRKNIETVNMAQNEMERAKAELAKLRGDFQSVLQDRNTQLASKTELRDQFQSTVGQLSLAEQNIGALRESLSQTKLEKDQMTTSVGGPQIAGLASLELDGRVTRVGDKDLVVVSLGSDEGLQIGDTLEVWRSNGSYVGRLVVVETKTDTAVARVVPEYLQGIIREGDNVGTKLL